MPDAYEEGRCVDCGHWGPVVRMRKWIPSPRKDEDGIERTGPYNVKLPVCVDREPCQARTEQRRIGLMLTATSLIEEHEHNGRRLPCLLMEDGKWRSRRSWFRW